MSDMKTNEEILKDYISSGPDPQGLTDTETELDRYLNDDDDGLISGPEFMTDGAEAFSKYPFPEEIKNDFGADPSFLEAFDNMPQHEKERYFRQFSENRFSRHYAGERLSYVSMKYFEQCWNEYINRLSTQSYTMNCTMDDDANKTIKYNRKQIALKQLELLHNFYRNFFIELAQKLEEPKLYLVSYIGIIDLEHFFALLDTGMPVAITYGYGIEWLQGTPWTYENTPFETSSYNKAASFLLKHPKSLLFSGTFYDSGKRLLDFLRGY